MKSLTQFIKESLAISEGRFTPRFDVTGKDLYGFLVDEHIVELMELDEPTEKIDKSKITDAGIELIASFVYVVSQSENIKYDLDQKNAKEKAKYIKKFFESNWDKELDAMEIKDGDREYHFGTSTEETSYLWEFGKLVDTPKKEILIFKPTVGYDEIRKELRKILKW